MDRLEKKEQLDYQAHQVLQARMVMMDYKDHLVHRCVKTIYLQLAHATICIAGKSW